MCRQDLARPRAVLVRPDHDVQHARRQNLPEHLAYPQRRQRRLRRRLQHHGVAAGERTSSGLPAEDDGRIPGRDDGDDANGAVPDHHLLLVVLRDHLLVVQIQLSGGTLEGCSGDEEFDAGLSDGPAALVGLQCGQGLRVQPQHIRTRRQLRRPFRGRHRCPGVASAVRSIYGGLKLLFRHLRRQANQHAGSRAQDPNRFFGRVDLTIDEQGSPITHPLNSTLVQLLFVPSVADSPQHRRRRRRPRRPPSAASAPEGRGGK
mmetsp:Transcript_91076/g.260596  ORF Transcript_91076/g.260596 Transcript_91076/m.260596 type:complete len:261 (+) Transcript_91076:1855-2637(+)